MYAEVHAQAWAEFPKVAGGDDKEAFEQFKRPLGKAWAQFSDTIKTDADKNRLEHHKMDNPDWAEEEEWSEEE
ncbi:hypothetical protein C8034_v001517 [Colletotrichum sidae]|uniref:Uncharacterized protein n=1 Tax=Colletotrichum sidae TaxID=1347389 RepID=A0A4R8TF55_9PEZI|nr:hypothetical protein C8034_v001517 [Colletotrichum sidae]